MVDLYEEIKRLISSAPDLGDVERALVRERAIRKTMARTGEGREVAAEAIDAIQSMDQEAILNLTDGAPTTMIDALARYVRILEQDGGTERLDVANDLGAILEHPWSAEEERLASHGINQALNLDIRRIKDGDGALERVEIRLGSNGWLILAADYEGHTRTGLEAIASTAGHVYRAVLARVIADRDHHVQLDGRQASDLAHWLTAVRSGSWNTASESRISVDAVSGGGILVRTRPYAYQHRVAAEQSRQREDARNVEEQARRALDNS